MKTEKTLKVILYKDCIMVKKIEDVNTKEGLNNILDIIEQWKSKDIKKNTVKFIIGRSHDI